MGLQLVEDTVGSSLCPSDVCRLDVLHAISARWQMPSLVDSIADGSNCLKGWCKSNEGYF